MTAEENYSPGESEGQFEPDADFLQEESDIEAALARETHDGSGFDNEAELPPSDFNAADAAEYELGDSE